MVLGRGLPSAPTLTNRFRARTKKLWQGEFTVCHDQVEEDTLTLSMLGWRLIGYDPSIILFSVEVSGPELISS